MELKYIEMLFNSNNNNTTTNTNDNKLKFKITFIFYIPTVMLNTLYG